MTSSILKCSSKGNIVYLTCLIKYMKPISLDVKRDLQEYHIRWILCFSFICVWFHSSLLLWYIRAKFEEGFIIIFVRKFCSRFIMQNSHLKFRTLFYKESILYPEVKPYFYDELVLWCWNISKRCYTSVCKLLLDTLQTHAFIMKLFFLLLLFTKSFF